MDYYKDSFSPYDWHDMAEPDILSYLSVWKLNAYNEYSNHETRTDMAFTFLNGDDHDKLLIDPAYRLQRFKESEEKTHIFMQALRDVKQRSHREKPPAPVPATK